MIAMVTNMIKRIGGVPAGCAEHVVVLCQDPRIRDLIAVWSSDAGLDVDVVTTGARAYECLVKHHHERQSLVMDRVLTPWPRLLSISRLKQKVPGLRVIVVQGEGTDAVAVAAAAGADAGISRPLQRADLFRVLDIEEKSAR